MMKELGAVEETMLIPLYARAVTTRSGLFHDPCAVRIVEALDYNFRRLADRTHVLGSVFRTAMFDEMLGAFLRRCPRATIVEIGAGLNARFERVDNGMLQWIDVDLPNVMRLRRQFFRETRRRRMVTSSVLDPDWIEPVIRAGGPYFVIAEGVFGYLPADHVKRALTLIAEQLPTARVAFDTTANEGCEHGKPVCPGLRARLAWECDDPHEVERWGLGYRLLESRALADLTPSILRALPFPYRSALAVSHVLGWKIVGSRLNLYEVQRRGA